MNGSIRKRMYRLEWLERSARVALLEQHVAKFKPLIEGLQAECEQAGHTFEHSHFNLGGDSVLRCLECNKHKKGEG
jgi:hypothetical protein